MRATRELSKRLEQRRLSPRTRQQARTVLRIALGAAVDDGPIAANAAVGKRMVPAQVRREHSLLTATQVNALLGLRLGEALGLKWSDLDVERAELRVQRSLVRPMHGLA